MNARANRIHITSSGPRTGTTLLAEVMKTCFEIDCYCDHEADMSVSNTSFGQCNTILTKRPSSTKNLDKILNWDPNLYVICLIRDPRDMICSFHGRIKDTYYCDLHFWTDFVKSYEKVHGKDRVLLIRYEDFTENPDLVQNIILKALPFLKKKYNFSDFHLYSKPNDDSILALKELRPIESKGIGNWRNHLPRIKQQMHEYSSLDDSLIKFGYERDMEWTHLLDSVAPERFETYTQNKRRKWRSSLILTFLNIFLEKRGLNPDKILAPIKKLV